MVKQKNDVVSTQQRYIKRIVITGLLLMVSLMGVAGLYVTLPPKTDHFPIAKVNDVLDEEIRLPQQANANEPFCIFVDSLIDGRVFDVPYEDYFYPQGSHSLPSLMELSEWKIEGVRVPIGDITWELFQPIPTILHICYPQGLGQGVYQMEFRLIDPTYVIYTRQWVLTVH